VENSQSPFTESCCCSTIESEFHFEPEIIIEFFVQKIVNSASLDVICDLTASVLKDVAYAELLQVLDHVDIPERLALVHSLVGRQLKVCNDDHEEKVSCIFSDD
jgi:hypothetical protein